MDDKARTKISFGFSKQIKSKVIATTEMSSADEGKKEVTMAMQTEEKMAMPTEVTHFENGLVNGQEKPKKKIPVIARIGQQNDWRIERLQKAVDLGTATEQQKALLALLREGLNPLPQFSSLSANDNVLEITKMDDDEPDDVDPDYDKISVSDFGAAFLRGRGWKKSEGIGRTNKRVVPVTIHATGKTFDLGPTKKKKTDEAEKPAEKDDKDNEEK